MDNTLKLGIAGFGRVVELVHLPLLKKLPEYEVSGIFDITPQRLALAAKRAFTTYSELEELLSSSIDALLIATPPNSHFDLAIRALYAGKHVLIEKPVTINAAEAIELKSIANQMGKCVTVFHNRRFDSDYHLVKRLIASGDLGNILFVERRYHMFGSGASFGVKSFHQDWRNEQAFGGGALLDWGVHLIDQLLHLGLGACTDIVASLQNLKWQQGEVDDYVHTTITTDQNVVMSMDINFASNVPTPSWIVGGDQATLQILSDREAYLYQKGEPMLKVTTEGQQKNGAAVIYTSFADCIRYGGNLAVTLEEAIETMKVLDKISECTKREKEMAHGDLILGSTS